MPLRRRPRGHGSPADVPPPSRGAAKRTPRGPLGRGSVRPRGPEGTLTAAGLGSGLSGLLSAGMGLRGRWDGTRTCDDAQANKPTDSVGSFLDDKGRRAWGICQPGAGAVAVKRSSAESGSSYLVYKAGPGPSGKRLRVRKSAGLVQPGICTTVTLYLYSASRLSQCAW